MLKYFIAVLVLIFGALASMYFWIGVPRVYRETFPEITPPYLYKDSSRPISDIKIAVFYFVPKNKIKSQFPDWQAMLEENLQRLQTFHTLQFQGRSRVFYEIYPQPIIGLQDNISYDTEVTQRGNPEALRRVAEELEARVFDPRGDLYNPQFADVAGDTYRVLMVMYEGVGASGSENVAFLSRVFLSGPQYQAIGATLLAHEFYHTLGIPDAYLDEKAVPLSSDIMGLERMRPIEKTFLSRETLRALGL